MDEPKRVFVDELPLTDPNAAVIVDTIRIAALTISTAVLLASPDPKVHEQPPLQLAAALWDQVSATLRAPAGLREDLVSSEED